MATGDNYFDRKPMADRELRSRPGTPQPTAADRKRTKENRGAEMSYTEEEARRLVVDAGIRLVKEGLTARTWGNISARISDSEFIITPSGMAYESLGPGDLVRCEEAVRPAVRFLLGQVLVAEGFVDR